MRLPVRFRYRAIQDIQEQVAFIAKESPAAALRFFDALEAASEHLSQWPYTGLVYVSSVKRLRNIRIWPVPGFERQLIFYRAMPDHVLIVRVLHSARDVRRIL